MVHWAHGPDAKECGQDMCAVTDTSSYIDSLIHRVAKDVGGNCSIRQKPSKISVDFKERHFEFRVNQESYGFVGVIIGFFIQKKHGFRNQNIVSILDAE